MLQEQQMMQQGLMAMQQAMQQEQQAMQRDVEPMKLHFAPSASDQPRESDEDEVDMEDSSPAPTPIDLVATLDIPLPSTGSALHALNKCRPCAWYWKAQGCINGQACAHCHLCPEGELKMRKQRKETAMRMGALLPARHGPESRSPRIVKIA